MINKKTVHEIKNLMDAKEECQVVDVREFPEFSKEHVAKSRLIPLSDFEKGVDEIDRSKAVYLFCRSGNRAKIAAEKLINKGFKDIHIVEGGITAWSAANLPLVVGESKVWSLERQVRFSAGMLTLLGVLLGSFVTSYFYLLSAFIGAGLMFSAATDTCTMGLLLAKMPWNQSRCKTA